MLKRISAFLLALVLAAGIASAYAEFGDDSDYMIQPGRVFKIRYTKSMLGNTRDNTYDSIPDLFPDNHGVRIYYGLWLEVPIDVYIFFGEDGFVYWISDYYRLRDTEASANLIAGGETAYEAITDTKPDYLYVSPSKSISTREFNPYIIDGKSIKYRLAFDEFLYFYTQDEAGEKTTLKTFAIDQRSKSAKKIKISDLEGKKIYELTEVNTIRE